jgi:hypothetical protein
MSVFPSAFSVGLLAVIRLLLKGLSHEIDFDNIAKN